MRDSYVMFLMTSGRQELLRRPPEDTITRTARRANDVPPPRYPAEESSSAPSYTPIYSHMAARRLDLDGPVPELFSEISSEAAPKYTGESDSPLAYKLGLRDFNTSTQIFQLTIQLIKKNQVLLEKIANGHVEAHQQSHPTYIALEHLNKLSKIFDTILDLLSKLNDANILKERERFEVFKLFDMAATPVGAGALLLRVHISQAIDLKGSNAATTWWVDHVRVLSKEHWRRLNDLYCMIVAEDFQRFVCSFRFLFFPNTLSYTSIQFPPISLLLIFM